MKVFIFILGLIFGAVGVVALNYYNGKTDYISKSYAETVVAYFKMADKTSDKK